MRNKVLCVRSNMNASRDLSHGVTDCYFNGGRISASSAKETMGLRDEEAKFRVILRVVTRPASGGNSTATSSG